MRSGSSWRSGTRGRMAAIARHEYRSAWRSRTIPLFTLVVGLLLGVACVVGAARATAETSSS